MPLSRCWIHCPALTAAGLAVGLGACQEPAEPVDPSSDATVMVAATVAAPAFALVSTGWDHTCGIGTDARAWCWGANQYGQLGTANTARSLTAVAVSGELSFEDLSSGDGNTCGAATGDLPYCWGRNGPSGTSTLPTKVDPSIRLVQVAAGTDHVCGLTAAGQAYCRGVNGSGQLGDGTTVDRSTLVAVAGSHVFRHISVSSYHTCAVSTDDRAFCWGDNSFGQLGDGNTGGGSTAISRVRPTAVAGGLRFRTISAGSIFTCGLTTDDRAYCWGSNLYGQIGDETLTDRTTPTAVHGGRQFTQLDAGNSHVCAVSTDHRGFCWGRAAEGQLGSGVFDPISKGMKPQAVAGALRFRQITGGGLHSCGTTTANVAYCWGYNNKGQLGNGTRSPRAKPTRVVGTG